VNSIIRQTDELFRYGSDGIALVCGGAIDADRLADIAGRVRVKLAAPFRVDADAAVHVGAVVATRQVPEGAVSAVDIMKSVVASVNRSLETAAH
jgi:GGDEF domain-containing protein